MSRFFCWYEYNGENIVSMYYLCNKEDNKLVRMEIAFFPKDFIVIEAESLSDQKLCDGSEEFLRDYMDTYLHSLLPESKNSPFLDEYICNRLGLDRKTLASGRLIGMEYLITLFENHFRDEKTETYLTAERATTISFFGAIHGWDRLFLDRPVTWDELEED